MRNKKMIVAGAIVIPLMAGFTGCRKYSGEKAQADRAEWLASLQDSISSISAQRKADSVCIEELRGDIDLKIRNFSQVANPRHVEPFYILSAFKGSYPLTSTGVAARITDRQQFELIVALDGKRFDAVRLSSGDKSVSSTVIPPDQGLNFTSSDGLTVCSFSGGENTPLGAFVAGHESNPVRLEYIRNGSVCHSINLSDPQKRWIGETWSLAADRLRLDSLEAVQMLSARKLEILHITLKNTTQHEPQ